MDINGVKVYGDITPLVENVLNKLKCTLDRKYWEGLKAIYINQNDYNKKRDATSEKLFGTYCRLEDISLEEKAGGEIIFNAGTPQEKTMKINKGEIPLICINSGFSSDPYYFAFVLLHELGHHNNFEQERNLDYKKNEINAHLFALKHIEKTEILQNDFDIFFEVEYYIEAMEIHTALEIKRLEDEFSFI
ncbi:hypothetical protein MOE28_09210 [Bacillus atrophaeus]|uniref:hypothetical protein n=1 Tax=Bacillus atrophaeus TaxID=1452 RepID=UPI002281FDC7|nr:hypothetical protein [Bacillus atrophaeus]MCY8950013.1 hypothetical protein [Bacillus atrophaeus]